MIDKKLLKAEAPFLDDTALDRFDIYAELLVYWNERINLTSITDSEEIVRKHFIDCLLILNFVNIPEGAALIDVGTGAGFPGLPLLIARPDLQVTLLDSTEKKLNVISMILKETGLTATLVHMRAEEAGRDAEFREKFDVITARAVAELRTLSEYCLPFLKPGGTFIAMKGADAETELSHAEHSLNILGGKLNAFHQFELNGCGERAVIEISKTNPTPVKYPRNSAQIKKNPL